MLENQTRCLRLAIPHNVEESNNIGASRKVLEDLDFTLDLLLLNRLEDFNDAFLVVNHVDAFEDFRVFSTTYKHLASVVNSSSKHNVRIFARVLLLTNLAHDLVVFQNAPADVHRVVIPVGARHLLVDIGVDPRHDCSCEPWAALVLAEEVVDLCPDEQDFVRGMRADSNAEAGSGCS
jgi:hypothetical protein